MPIPKVCPLMVAIRKNPEQFIKKAVKAETTTAKEVLTRKPIGEAAAKTDAWWHDGYREAKEIETAIREGTYKAPEAPEIRREDGGLNLGYFHSFDEDGLI